MTKSVSADRLAISEVTTPSTSFEEHLRTYSDVGIAAISIAQGKLDPTKADEQLRALEASCLQCSAGLPAHIGVLPTGAACPGPTDLDERLELVSSAIRDFAPFRPSTLVVVSGALGDYAPAEARRIAVEGLRELARVAAEFELSLRLESVRPGHDPVGLRRCSRQHPSCCTAGERCASQRHYRKRRGPRDRFFPGDGVIDLPAIIEALEAGGYEGFYDIEIFSDDGRFGTTHPDAIWALSTEEVTRRSAESSAKVWPTQSY